MSRYPTIKVSQKGSVFHQFPQRGHIAHVHHDDAVSCVEEDRDVDEARHPFRRSFEPLQRFLLILRRHPGQLLIELAGLFPDTHRSRHQFRKYPDRINGVIVDRSEQVWVSDITYIHLRQGFAYLSLVTDAYSRKIVGSHLSADLGTQGPEAAVQMAISERKGKEPLIHHSDRGAQYCSDRYVKILEANHIGISMTQSGNPRDNAIAERVNGILKQELLGPEYTSITQARAAVGIAIETYNHMRPHCSVDMLTPQQAHQHTGEIRRRWRSYYHSKGKEVRDMSG